ncbi:MAG: hypothetical protein AAB610_03060 [Patescibacteria group bacterium]
METKFQTSFIPKKPLVSDQKMSSNRSAGTSIFMFVAIILFVASIAGAVFSVLWKNVLNKSQENYKVQLAESEKRFNLSLIEELKKANTKIDLSKQLLKGHLAVSELFSIISRLTIEGIRFTSFEFVAPAKDSEGIKISMRGVGNSFSAIAFQSDVFGQSQKYGTNKILKNPVLSDLALDANGNVGFTFSTIINPGDVLYEKILTSDESNETTP